MLKSGRSPSALSLCNLSMDYALEPVQLRLDKSLQKRFEGIKVIIGVDRLDYIKGLPQKLHAFEVFLAQHPEWVGKVSTSANGRSCYSAEPTDQVVLVQLAIPSRQDVEEYQNLRACVNELVGRINGRFGTVEFTPIHFHAQIGPRT